MNLVDISNYCIDINDYVEGERIGKGAYGEVFIFRNKKTNELYAGKIFYNPQEKSLLREIAAQSIDHPAILKLKGFKISDPTIILTPYMKNGTLDDKLRKFQLNPTQKQIILYGVAKGIEFIHSKNTIHRDLKPANILLDENLYPKITDFGLSKFKENIYDTNQSIICGTPKYHAPEVITGDYNYKADIYSFGIIMYEVLTNRIIEREINLKNPFIPSRYRQIILECLNANIKKRPELHSITEFLKNNPLDGADAQELRAYDSIFDKYSIDIDKITENDKAYEEAKSCIEDKNMIKAAKYMKISADNGHPDARLQYSQMLFDGNGVAQDIKEGFKYLKKAAIDDNNSEAQLKLALIYLEICEGNAKYDSYQEEEDLDQSYYIKEAAKYMKLAADAGDSKAQYNYSLMLAGGHGIAEDDEKSDYYLKMAATNENPNKDALNAYANKCILGNDISHAEHYYQIAADNLNSLIGQYNYGKLLLDRKENKKSETTKRAFDYIRRSADNEDCEDSEIQAKAQNLVGVCLHEGIGIKKNVKEAAQYFEKAAQKNNPEAIFNIGLEIEKKQTEKIEAKMRKLSQAQTQIASPLSSPAPFSRSQTTTLKSKSSAPLAIGEKDNKKLFEEAFKKFKKAADLNCMEAADYYATAICDDNIREAEEYYLKAAKEGNIDHAQYKLAEMYFDVNDKKNGMKHLTIAANQNYPPAQFLLAKQNEENNKIKDALKYYQMAADQNFDQEKDRNIAILTANIDLNQDNFRKDAILAAIKNFTLLLINGKQENRNIELALKYAKKGKELGSIPCSIEYAKLTNDVEMIKDIADNNNDKDAQFEYAKMIQSDNLDECVHYLTLSADQCQNEACMTLVYLYERKILFDKKLPNFQRNMDKARYYCQMAADDHYVPALTQLGLNYAGGVGVKKDINKAKFYFKKSIEYGNNVIALFNYADILMSERNKTEDKNQQDDLYKEAFEYYKEAAKQNSPEGQFRYANLVLEILEKKEQNELNNELTDSQNEDFGDEETEINYKNAETNLKNSAKSGYPDAIFKYSEFLMDIKKDIRKGMEYLKKAADHEKENNIAKFKYGKYLFEGYNYINRKNEEKFKQDKQNGLKYIKEAADNKLKAAQDYLESSAGKSDNKTKIPPKILLKKK